MTWMSGNEAIALGAWEAGVKVASGYPGTPSTEILEHLSTYAGVATEWAPNEKVALEVALGASFAGVRALATMKHVGLNVAADPLFTASYTGVRGGLVIITADDPEMHSSQNEQDNRNYALAAKLPLLEPSDPAEARELLLRAFALSEEYDTPVLLRTTTRIAHVKGVVRSGSRQEGPAAMLERAPAKLVMLPANARRRRLAVEERMNALRGYAESAAENRREAGQGRRGFLTAGVSYNYVKEAFPQAPVLKLGLVWPLPERLIRDFAGQVDELVVVEELDPFLETQVRALGLACRGKDVIPAMGELNTSIVRRALDPQSAPVALAPVELPPRPPNMCAGCPHRGVFHALSRMRDVFVSGDIGCYTLGFLPPLSAMDSCVCMGASITVAHGLTKALGAEAVGKVVAVLGDSTFMHSGMTGLLNSVYNGDTSTVIILDNRTTAMTGHQHNPASGAGIKGDTAPALDIEALCRALGVRHVTVVNPHEMEHTRQVLQDEIARAELSVVISRAPCVLLPEERKRAKVPLTVAETDCTGCRTCLQLGCPALSWREFAPGEALASGHKEKQKGVSRINAIQCTGCGQCAALCKFDAITPLEEK
ncbi:MAG: indolepyruvate ferredoxin oxidoreductase subunit alpha [Desulfobulbaceae bacterium A2]|nr:MAG: indolepyruvate ferredoxin oxidoreductase subunit alpha [Desulfobulbaceae bacterium A2]